MKKMPKGKKANNYIDGRKTAKHYCIESNCNNTISYCNWLYGSKQCSFCSHKSKRGMKRPEHSILMIKNNPFKNKKHTKISKGKISQKAKERFKDPKNHPMFGKSASHGKRIYYKGISMRSSWETLYAKYLDKNNIKWLYEPKRFYFKDCTYMPDFYLPEIDEYIEIKGYWRDNTKKRYNLFRKKYPQLKVEVLNQKKLQKLGILIT